MAKKEKEKQIHEDIFIRITKNIENFIVKNIKIIAISLSVIAVVLGAYFAVEYAMGKKERQAQAVFDKVYLSYTEITGEAATPQDQTNEKLLGVAEDFKKVISDYPKSRAAAKSAFYTGEILYTGDDYEQAATFFEQGVSIRKNYYISLLCLQRLASCYSQLQLYDRTLETYDQIEKRFKGEYIIPMVIFNKGEIYETTSRLEKANDEYAKLVTEYPWSSWKGFAEKRQLLIKNQL